MWGKSKDGVFFLSYPVSLRNIALGSTSLAPQVSQFVKAVRFGLCTQHENTWSRSALVGNLAVVKNTRAERTLLLSTPTDVRKNVSVKKSPLVTVQCSAHGVVNVTLALCEKNVLLVHLMPCKQLLVTSFFFSFFSCLFTNQSPTLEDALAGLKQKL